MTFLSPGDLCGIETKFMCIFSRLSRSLSLLVRCCFWVFHFTSLPWPGTISPPNIYASRSPALSHLRIRLFLLLFCVSLHSRFAFVSLLISIFLSFFSHFFGHFRSKFWPCFFRFCSVWCHALFSPNAALGNCVWNREWNGNGNGSGNPSSTLRGVHKICHVHLLLCLRLIWSEKCQKATENWVNKLWK